jgi:ribosomal protein L12E/L44/L45/RPP1/RPP2
MPSNSLRSTLDSLATSFAGAVLDAIKGASIQELLAESAAAPRRGPGRPRASAAAHPAAAAAKPARRAKAGRLARRSPEEITETLDRIHGLLKGKKAGMRSEEIRKALKLDVREVPRVLKEGLSKKKLKSRGQKRATTYTVG